MLATKSIPTATDSQKMFAWWRRTYCIDVDWGTDICIHKTTPKIYTFRNSLNQIGKFCKKQEQIKKRFHSDPIELIERKQKYTIGTVNHLAESINSIPSTLSVNRCKLKYIIRWMHHKYSHFSKHRSILKGKRLNYLKKSYVIIDFMEAVIWLYPTSTVACIFIPV